VDYLKLAIYILLFLLSIHLPSYAMSLLAYHKYGDSTPKLCGRMRWYNPIPSLDIFGTITVFFLWIAWPKPMDTNFNNLGKNRHHLAIIEATGLGVTLALVLVGGLLYLLFSSLQHGLNLDLRYIMGITEMFTSFNMFMLLLKLLPIPPMPGFRILAGYLYHKPQGLFDSLPLAIMGSVIIVVLILWTPLTAWLSSGVSGFLGIFGTSGNVYLNLLTKIPTIGGFYP